MLSNKIFSGILNTEATSNIVLSKFLLCVGAALIIGMFIALVYTYKSRYTKSFVVTLAILPSVVCMIIIMVNGSLGVGVAVAGAFSLVRFRSIPGTAKEIGAIFIAMGIGLATGMGYIGYAFLFSIIVNIVILIYTASSIGEGKNNQRTMRITIPEDLDYTGVFDDLFTNYTSHCDLLSVKTTNMGSLFKLTYDLVLADANQEKDFIDELRCRNGNLEIILAKQSSVVGEL
nr:DUF4956 domain-containing protein [Tissierella sp.]